MDQFLMELPLSKEDKNLYTKLYASMCDIVSARGFAFHIKKKSWYRGPWSRGTIYFQQSAYVTSLIVSYGRPFNTGRNGYNFPRKLINYTEDEWALHNDLIERRNKIYAHSDLQKWNIRPWRHEKFQTDIVNRPILVLEKEKIDVFLTMTENLQQSISNKMKEIISRY